MALAECFTSGIRMCNGLTVDTGSRIRKLEELLIVLEICQTFGIPYSASQVRMFHLFLLIHLTSHPGNLAHSRMWH
jgi:hypothetical protein